MIKLKYRKFGYRPKSDGSGSASGNKSMSWSITGYRRFCSSNSGEETTGFGHGPCLFTGTNSKLWSKNGT